MANFIPFLAFGAATAYVVSSHKDKQAKNKCPKVNRITSGDLAAASNRADKKFKSEPDPAMEAAFTVSTLLEKCSRSSSDSDVILTFEGLGNTSIELSVPELYIMLVGNIADKKLHSGLITMDTYESIHEREMKWFKSTTGENLDPVALNERMQPIAEAFMNALLDGLQDELDADAGKGGAGACPSVVNVDPDRDLRITSIAGQPFPVTVINEVGKGNRDVLDISRKLFRELIPSPCQPEMQNLSVVPPAGYGIPAPEYYFWMADAVVEMMVFEGWLTISEADVELKKLDSWWKQVMGNQKHPLQN